MEAANVPEKGGAMLPSLPFSSFFLLPSPNSLLLLPFGSLSCVALLSSALISGVADPDEADGISFSGGIARRHCIAPRTTSLAKEEEQLRRVSSSLKCRPECRAALLGPCPRSAVLPIGRFCGTR